jgi:hypothetical protein
LVKLISITWAWMPSFMCDRFLMMNSVTFCLFQTGSCYVGHTYLKLKIFMPQPPECWDCRPAPLFPAWIQLLQL